jgi:hypothetical protein
MHLQHSQVRRVIAIRSGESCKTVLYVSIKNANVYVHYLDRSGTEVGHASQHASGQRHFRRANGDFLKWTEGVTGGWEDMKIQRTPPAQIAERDEIGAFGFAFGDLANLPDCPNNDPEMILCELPADCHPEMLVFQTSIVGIRGAQRNTANGNFPVVWRTRFANDVTVEIEAIAVNQPQ